jgi:hypothetical protein
MQTNTTTQATTTQATTTTTTQATIAIVEYDFENDDDAFYDLIDFGISSNRGRLSIKGA